MGVKRFRLPGNGTEMWPFSCLVNFALTNFSTKKQTKIYGTVKKNFEDRKIYLKEKLFLNFVV